MAACVGTYGACGTAGHLVAPTEASLAPFVFVSVVAVVAVVVPPMIVARLTTRSGGRWLALLIWSIAVAGLAFGLSGREERLHWPVHASVSLATKRPMRMPAPSAAAAPAASAPPAVADQVSSSGMPGLVDLEGKPIVFTYAAARPVSEGIEIALSDTPVDCATARPARATFLLLPDGEGGFYFDREVPTYLRTDTSGLSFRYPGFGPLARAGVTMTLSRFELVPGARVVGRVAMMNGWTPERAEWANAVTRPGSFSTELCGHDELGSLLEGWRAPPAREGALEGRVQAKPFVVKGAAAYMATLADGREALKRIRIWNTAGGDGCSPWPNSEGRVLVVHPFTPLAGVTPRVLPARLEVHALSSSFFSSAFAATLEITSYGDPVEAKLSAWSTHAHPKNGAPPGPPRSTEVSGKVQLKRCKL